MMSAGYLYVLINSSMPGIVKVGKTTRNPENRVSELSSATGVATPFILAFQQPFSDCHSAERWVHEILEQSGKRVASNREFFNAPVHEVISIILHASSLNFSTENNDSDTPTQDKISTNNDVSEIMELASAYEDGTDSVLKNAKKAVELYKVCGKAGEPYGWVCAGNILRYGEGNVRQDLEDALNCYKNALELGHWRAYASIASIFIEANQPKSAEANWINFWTEAESTNKSYQETAVAGLSYFNHVFSKQIDDVIESKYFSKFRGSILRVAKESMDFSLNNNNETPEYREQFERFLCQRFEFIEHKLRQT